MSHFESVGTSALAGDLIQRIGDGWMLISIANRETGTPNTMTASWGPLHSCRSSTARRCSTAAHTAGGTATNLPPLD